MFFRSPIPQSQTIDYLTSIIGRSWHAVANQYGAKEATMHELNSCSGRRVACAKSVAGLQCGLHFQRLRERRGKACLRLPAVAGACRIGQQRF